MSWRRIPKSVGMSDSALGDLRGLAMTKAYSIDLRERIIRAVGGGASAREAARIFFVSPSSAIKWIQRWRVTGSCARSAVRGLRRSPLIDHRLHRRDRNEHGDDPPAWALQTRQTVDRT